MPTGASAALPTAVCPIPRSEMVAPVKLPLDISMFGTLNCISMALKMRFLSRLSWEKAETAIGVSCSEDSRFSAVTIISSKTFCALAWVAAASAVSAKGKRTLRWFGIASYSPCYYEVGVLLSAHCSSGFPLGLVAKITYVSMALMSAELAA